jgi:DNA-binding NarL/FixJ family response regulator
MKKNFDLILVDDHKMFRDALKFVLEKTGCFTVIAEASSGNEFLEIAGKYHSDLILTDISMPGINGIDATRMILQKYPELKVVGLSMYDDEVYSLKMINAGAKGFICKKSGSKEFFREICRVLNCRECFPGELLQN